ncbi:hypothetical protein GO497_08995 [Acidovorax citrulli]|nr:hypothetical protein [Paracidovorax citrulli]
MHLPHIVKATFLPLTGEMTAAPLLSSYRSIMALRCREEDRPFFKVLCTRIQRITEQRNNIVHGTWYVGWGNDPMSMFFDAPGVKIKNSSSGPKDVNMTLSEDTFRPFIRECQELHELVFLMTVSVIDGSAVSERCELTGPKERLCNAKPRNDVKTTSVRLHQDLSGRDAFKPRLNRPPRP